MSVGLDEVVRRFAGLERREVMRWVENRWVLPERAGGDWHFHEVDLARVELILEICRDFAVEEDALGLVLGLLDQLYGMRHRMRRLCEALAAQDPAVRQAITRALAGDPEE